MKRRKPDPKMELEEYMKLYDQFSPEKQLGTVRGIQQTAQAGAEDEFAQRNGYPSLGALREGNDMQQYEDTKALQAARFGREDAREAYDSTLGMVPPEVTQQLLQNYLKAMGIVLPATPQQ